MAADYMSINYTSAEAIAAANAEFPPGQFSRGLSTSATPSPTLPLAALVSTSSPNTLSSSSNGEDTNIADLTDGDDDEAGTPGKGDQEADDDQDQDQDQGG